MPAVLAHPLVLHGGLPVPSAVVATAAVVVALALARLVPTGARRPDGRADAPARPGGEGVPQASCTAAAAGWRARVLVAARVLGVLLYALAVVAGRAGDTDELDNIAPALVVGFGWPALVLASALVGNVWGWLNPLQALAGGWRAPPGHGPDAHEPLLPGGVRWAVVAGVAWCAYLATWPRALHPRSVALLLAVYAVVTVAGCIAVGRRRWLHSAEVVSILLGWIARLPRRRMVPWEPPAGAAVLVGAVAGGLTFAALRYSTVWVEPLLAASVDPAGASALTAGLVACCGIGAAAVAAAERGAQRSGASGAAVVSAVPVLAAIAVAVGMARDRFTTSAQLVVQRASDPLGRGWDALGTADLPIAVSPLGTSGRLLVQLAVLVAGGVAGAAVARRRAPGSWPTAVWGAGVLLWGAVVAVTAV